jgi:PEP-CTERM motif
MKRLGRRNCHRMVGLAVLGLMAALALGKPAQADSTLQIGSTYPPGFNFTLFGNYVTESGGNITSDFLDGKPLTYLYCIAANVDIDVPGTYDVTLSTAGVYNGNVVNNAGEISWLLTNLASSAVTQDEQSGLQGAIWKQIYGANFVLDQVNNDANLVAAYNADITALGTNTAPLSNLIWITPYNADTSVAQGLITLNSVPEPSSFVLAGSGVLGGLAFTRWKRRVRTA